MINMHIISLHDDLQRIHKPLIGPLILATLSTPTSSVTNATSLHDPPLNSLQVDIAIDRRRCLVRERRRRRRGDGAFDQRFNQRLMYSQQNVRHRGPFCHFHTIDSEQVVRVCDPFNAWIVVSSANDDVDVRATVGNEFNERLRRKATYIRTKGASSGAPFLISTRYSERVLSVIL